MHYILPRDPFLVPRLSFHVNHAPDAIARSHRAETLVDLIKRLAMRDELVNFQLAVLVILDESTHLRSAFYTSEGTASPYASCYEL
jgi:hypothetical protein